MAERHDEDSLAESAERMFRQLQTGSDAETSKDLPKGVHQILRLLAESHDSTPSSNRSETSPRTPISIDRFQLIRPLGQGGYGVVYLARDALLKRVVALKLPKPHVLLNRDLRKRFLREARAASNLHHSHIAQVYDASETSDASYIACEYCDGGSLADWLERNDAKLEPDTVAKLVSQLADAVHHAHDAGILHRDLKPSNILLQSTPGVRQAGLPYVAKVADFGLAKLESHDEDATLSGVILGSIRYMAPEQALARSREIDVRTDVYSLGVIMYQLLTGSVPFESDSQLQLLQHVVERSPTRVRQLSPDTPRDLAAICMKCLEKRQARRYQTAALLRDDLVRFLNGQPTVARPVMLPERAFRWSMQNRALSSLMSVVLLFVLIGVTGLMFYNRKIQRTVDELELATAELTQQTDVATAALALAENREENLRVRSYTSDVAVAYASWWRQRPRQAAQILERHKPVQGLADVRGAEWHLLYGLIRPPVVEPYRGKSPVHGVILPGGESFAFVDESNIVRFLDVDSGKITRTLEAPYPMLREIAVSHDGRFLCVAATEETVNEEHPARIGVFDLESGEFAQLGSHISNVESMAFAPDSYQMASGSRYENLQIWDVQRRTELSNEENGSRNESIRFSPCGRWLAYFTWRERGDRHCLKVVDRSSGESVCEIPIQRKDEFVCFSSDGQWMAVSSLYTIDIYEMDGFTLFESLRDLHARPSELTFTPNDEMLIASGRDGTLRFWEFIKPKDTDDILRPMRHFVATRSSDYHQTRIRSIAFDHRRRMITSGEDGAIRIVDPWLTQIGPDSKVARFDSAPDGTMAAMLCTKGRFWVKTDEKSQVVQLKSKGLDWKRQLAISSDGQWIAYSWMNELGVVKSEQPDQVVWEIESPTDAVTGMDIAPRKPWLVTTHLDDEHLYVWDVRDGSLIRSIHFPTIIAAPRFSPDGRTLILAEVGGANRMYVCDGDGFQIHRKLPLIDELHIARFSPNGQVLATGHIDGQVGLWSTDTWELKHWGTEHEPRWLSALSFSPDGKTLASGTADGTRLWHVPTGRGLGQLLHTHTRGLSFAPDGQSLLIANETEPWIIQLPISAAE